MSDALTAAAQSLGLPESLVSRSAQARAAETGMTEDEILAAWAAGGSMASMPTNVAGPEPPPAEPVAEPEANEVPVTPDLSPPMTASTTPAVIQAPVTATGKPPVLIEAVDNPLTILAGVIGLFLALLLVGVVGPSLPVDTPGARSSNIAYTAQGLAGQDIYLSLGCDSCHTQMVRPIVADVGLGPVSLPDSNQILGTRRNGPDLSDVGSRLSGSDLETIIEGSGSHPRFSLSQADLDDLVSYLLESSTSVAG